MWVRVGRQAQACCGRIALRQDQQSRAFAAHAGAGASLRKAYQKSIKNAFSKPSASEGNATSSAAEEAHSDGTEASTILRQEEDAPFGVEATPALAAAAADSPPAAPPAAAAAGPWSASSPGHAVQGHFQEFAPQITVVGVGGAGGNAVNNMIARNLSGVEFMVANTDAQHLATCLTDNRIQLGRGVTQGLGCGANPDAGRQAAMESKEEILDMVGRSHMVFITAGMGGGTGTGAAPVVAEACLEAGILTVGVVTKPFSFEGTHRMRLADEGLSIMKDCVDTMIVVPNQNLFQLVSPQTSLMDAFRLADDVLLAGVRSVTDLMVNPGLINLDFADVQAVMAGMGNAMMGTGEAEGEDRAIKAAEDALSNPLLGQLSCKTAKGLLVSITGGADMTLFEVDAAATRITNEVEDKTANIIFGSAYDSSLEGKIRVSVVATGIEGDMPPLAPAKKA